MRSEAGKDAAAVRAEAASELEEARAKAAHAAKDFETTLSRRRDQAEQELSARLAEVERRLAETNEAAEQVKRDADAHRADSERRASQILEAAKREAETLVNEATGNATRQRSEVERELATLVRRRDSVQAQLQNVREMLATMTGGPVGSAGEDEESPAEEQQPPKPE